MIKQDIGKIKTENSDKPPADASGKKEKPLREVSVEGCELLGKGGNGAVYRLDDETIIKVYFGERNTLDRIRKSRKNTRDAFVHGVPSMIAFDMVRVGDNYGVVYEMINAKSMNQGIKPKQYARLWDIIVRRYFETDSPGIFRKSIVF